MFRIANIDLHAATDVTRGSKIPLNGLFPSSELWQEFEVLDNIVGDKTKIKVDIASFESFLTKSNSSRAKGDKSGLLLILQRDDFKRKVTATGDIKKGEKLAVSLEKM